MSTGSLGKRKPNWNRYEWGLQGIGGNGPQLRLHY